MQAGRPALEIGQQRPQRIGLHQRRISGHDQHRPVVPGQMPRHIITACPVPSCCGLQGELDTRAAGQGRPDVGRPIADDHERPVDSGAARARRAHSRSSAGRRPGPAPWAGRTSSASLCRPPSQWQLFGSSKACRPGLSRLAANEPGAGAAARPVVRITVTPSGHPVRSWVLRPANILTGTSDCIQGLCASWERLVRFLHPALGGAGHVSVPPPAAQGTPGWPNNDLRHHFEVARPRLSSLSSVSAGLPGRTFLGTVRRGLVG